MGWSQGHDRQLLIEAEEQESTGGGTPRLQVLSGGGRRAGRSQRPPLRVVQGLPPRPNPLSVNPPQDLSDWAFENTLQVLEATDRVSAATLALKVLQSIIPAESGAVLLPDEGGIGLRFLAATGPCAGSVRAITLPLYGGIAGRIFRTGECVMVEDLDHETRHLHDVDAKTGYHPRALLAVPIHDPGWGTIGCLELLHPSGRFLPWQAQAALEVSLALGSWLSSRSVV